jgi:hypothetical protein
MNKVVASLITGLAVLLVVGGVAAGLFFSGRLAFVNPDAEVTDTYTAVCDTTIVDAYNEASIYESQDGSSDLVLDEEGIKSIKSDINKLAGNKNDPTCQSILFLIAIYDDDYETAKATYERVKSLHEKRLFADSNLLGNQALSAYEGVVYSMSPEGRESGGAGD